jgi:hypothetical protein
MMEILPAKSSGGRTIGLILESAEQEQEQSEHRKEQATEALRVIPIS